MYSIGLPLSIQIINSASS